jgi:hypothetical protein
VADEEDVALVASEATVREAEESEATVKSEAEKDVIAEKKILIKNK